MDLMHWHPIVAHMKDKKLIESVFRDIFRFIFSSLAWNVYVLFITEPPDLASAIEVGPHNISQYVVIRLQTHIH